MEKSAGIAIIYDGKILMSHATRSPWFRSWMPPKGKLEEGETKKEAAIREVLHLYMLVSIRVNSIMYREKFIIKSSEDDSLM
jgi:ADP-ribose pyrophosphatase YjhB (NUDIX family)